MDGLGHVLLPFEDVKTSFQFRRNSGYPTRISLGFIAPCPATLKKKTLLHYKLHWEVSIRIQEVALKPLSDRTIASGRSHTIRC
jgi:hypothetical protein